jgi:putative ABC transport system permease protein
MFTADDRPGALPVALINASMRRRYWAEGDPIGATLRRGEGAERTAYVIVGVVGDMKQRALDGDAEPEVIVSSLQHQQPAFFRPRALVVRTNGRPEALVGHVRQAIAAVNPRWEIPEVRPLDDAIAAGLGDRLQRTVLLSAFAGLTLLLSVIGVYALVSSAVTDRTQELGLRLALGAPPRALVRMLVGEGAVLALVGCSIGLTVALAVTRMLVSFLYGVTPADPVSFAAASTLMFLVALCASYLPARRIRTINLRTALSLD